MSGHARAMQELLRPDKVGVTGNAIKSPHVVTLTNHHPQH